MTELVIAVLALAACVYGMSCGSKLTRRRNYRAFRDGLGETSLVPGRLLGATAAILAGSETAVATLLGAATVLAAAGLPGSFQVADIALGCGIALTSVLTAGVTVVIRSGTYATCACFGARSRRELSGAHLARNVAILVMLLTGLIGNQFRLGQPAPAMAMVAVGAGAIVALLLVRSDDLAELFAPARRQSVR
jgi:hypothetical protein